MSNSAFTPTVLQNFAEASVSQSGIVNTTAQTFGGIKTFDPSVAFTPKTGFATGYQLWKDTSSRLRLNFSGGLLFADDTDATTYFSVSSSGGLTFGRSSGNTGQHIIQGDGTANYTLAVTATNASASSGQSNGLAIRAGITSADTPFTVANRAGSTGFGSCNGVGAWVLGTLGGTEIQRAYGSEFRLQGESSSGTQLGPCRTKLFAPVRQNIAPSSSGTFENGQAGAVHIVKGYGTGDNASKRFTDFVVTTESGWTTPTAVLHSSGINSPNARTYTVDGSNRLVVSLGSGGTNNFEVNVAVFSI
jgi:hypothetical protein